MDEVAGWFIQGLWIQFGDVGLHVYNGADANGISDALGNRLVRTGRL